MKKFITKINRKKAFKAYKKQRNFCSRLYKKRKRFSIILICLLLLTISYSEKRLKHSFQTREIMKQKLNSRYTLALQATLL